MVLSSMTMSYLIIGLIVVILALIAWLVVFQIRLSRVIQQYNHLVAGTDGGSLEEVLNQHIDQVQTHLEAVSELQTQTRRIDRTLKHTMQWMGLVRYNPFRDTGGNQSFAWTIVDGYGLNR